MTCWTVLSTGFPGAPWSRLPIQQCVSLPHTAPWHVLPPQTDVDKRQAVTAEADSRPELWTFMIHSVNVTWGPKEERLLITGVHTVADIYCTSCNTVLGWKYVRSCSGLKRSPGAMAAHAWRARRSAAEGCCIPRDGPVWNHATACEICCLWSVLRAT